MSGCALLAGALGICGGEPFRCQRWGGGPRCEERAPAPGVPGAVSCWEVGGVSICALASAPNPPGAPWRCAGKPALGPQAVLCTRSAGPVPGALPQGTLSARVAGPVRRPDRAAWRCWREGTARVCEPRDLGNDDWTCAGNNRACRRRYPDFPGDGEWDCYEALDRVICRGDQAEPVRAPWICALRPGGGQICVDVDPDRPDAVGAWDCHYHEAGDNRVCLDRGTGAAPSCDDAGCRFGVCVAGRCALGTIAPLCYDDGDCPAGTCRGGVCWRA